MISVQILPIIFGITTERESESGHANNNSVTRVSRSIAITRLKITNITPV